MLLLAGLAFATAVADPLSEPEMFIEICDGLDNDGNGTVDDDSACPYEMGRRGEHVYLFRAESISWSEAKQACARIGYSLTTISSEAENMWIAGQTHSLSDAPWWIGVEPIAEEIWADGSALRWSHWASTPPTAIPTPCTTLTHQENSVWMYESCEERHRFICEAGSELTLQYIDADQDDYGDSIGDSMYSSDFLEEYAVVAGDCNDQADLIYPGSIEFCDGIDQDCNDQIDEDAIDMNIYYEDQDGDGFGREDGSFEACSLPNGASNLTGDCDDLSASTYPGAVELDDGIDNDCNEWPDDGLDADGDGLQDPSEAIYGTDSQNPDSDDDGLNDAQELFETETNPLDSDSDGDGLSDGDEWQTIGSDPNQRDTDLDGLADGEEVEVWGSNPSDIDSDNDGFFDGEEVHLYQTHPAEFDTDGDGFGDAEEVLAGTDPLDAADFIVSEDTGEGVDSDSGEAGDSDSESETDDAVDSDGDGLTDVEEQQLGTDPNDADTDDGGVNDGQELFNGTNPLDISDDFPIQQGLSSDAMLGRTCGCDISSGLTGSLWAVSLLGLGLSRRRQSV